MQRLPRLLGARPRVACRLLFYTKMWGMRDDLSNVPLRRGFSLLKERERPEEADVVVFQMPTLSNEEAVILRKDRKRRGQL